MISSRNDTREKKIVFFHVFDIAIRLSRHSVGLMNELQKKPWRFSIQARLSEFFRIMAAKTLKNLYRSQPVTLKLSYKRKKTKIWNEKSKVSYSVALVMAQLSCLKSNLKANIRNI